MLRKPIAAFGILLITFTLFFLGCRKKDNQVFQDDLKLDYAAIIAKRFGLPLASVKDTGDFVIVGGDMIFPKSQIISETQKRQVVASTDNATLSFGGGPIDFAHREDIKIFISDEAPTSTSTTKTTYRNGIGAAISNFNSLISGTSIKMREVSTIGVSDIVIHLVNWGTNGTLGTAWYPLNGEPGENIYLNAGYSSSTVAQVAAAATHELGHALGLFHTDQIPDSSLTKSHDYNGTGIPFLFYLKTIPGTPGFATQDIFGLNPDPQSFMNEFGANRTWTQSLSNPTGVGFSDFDMAAIQYLYPKFEIVGSSSLCNSATYSVSNLPTGATASWDLSDNTLGSISSSGSTTTVTRTGYGTVNINATVSVNGKNFTITKTVDLGHATPEAWTNLGATATLGGCYQFSYLSHRPGTTYKWTLVKIPGGTPQTVSTTVPLELCFESLGRYNLSLSITNSCVTNKVVYTRSINVLDDDGPIH